MLGSFLEREPISSAGSCNPCHFSGSLAMVSKSGWIAICSLELHRREFKSWAPLLHPLLLNNKDVASLLVAYGARVPAELTGGPIYFLTVHLVCAVDNSICLGRKLIQHFPLPSTVERSSEDLHRYRWPWRWRTLPRSTLSSRPGPILMPVLGLCKRHLSTTPFKSATL